MSAKKSTSTKIGELFSFGRYGLSIPKAKEALEYYSSNNKTPTEWLSKDSKIPIFIDTNILLKLYKISKENRSEMLSFLEQNKNRIFICGQIGQEYLKHRCAEIKHYSQTIIDLQKEVLSIVDKIKGVPIRKAWESLLKNEILKDDMPKSYEILNKLWKLFNDAIRELESVDLYDSLNESIKNEGESLISDFQYEYNDPILDIISSLNHLDGLSEEEDLYTKNLYDTLLNEYKTNNSNEDYSFPGSGDDKKLKYGRPAHGDLAIFHEMLRYAKDANTDSIFVTLDVTKGDWVRRNGMPFIHYIYSIFNLTGHMIYICSERDFPMSFDSVSGDKNKDEHADDDIEEVVEQTIDAMKASNEGQIENDQELSASSLNHNDQCANQSEILGITFKEKQQTTSSKRYISSGYREIDQDSFISELRMAIDWAKNYGAGYVNKYLFIYKILRNHHYDYNSSNKIMEQLLKAGKIILHKEEHDGREMECLDIMTSEIVPISNKH